MSLPLVPSYLSHIANCSKQISVRATSPELSHIAKCAKQICSILLLQAPPFAARWSDASLTVIVQGGKLHRRGEVNFKISHPHFVLKISTYLLFQRIFHPDVFFENIFRSDFVSTKFPPTLCFEKILLIRVPALQQWVVRGACLFWGTEEEAV